jgi:hypothetical protein
MNYFIPGISSFTIFHYFLQSINEGTRKDENKIEILNGINLLI